MTDAGRQPFFLATARGGHSADPGSRCPFCGGPAGVHRGVDLAGSRAFPMRAVICDGAPRCERCGDRRWLGAGFDAPCTDCNAEGRP